jgi:hypothetical protein
MARDKNDPDKVLAYPDKDRGMDDACDAARYALMDIFSTERMLRPKALVTPQTLDEWQEAQDEIEERKRLAAALMSAGRRRRW